MAVSTEHTKDILMGDGVNTKFPFTFQVIEKAQIHCLKVLASGEEIELLNTEFEIKLNDNGGGEVTYPLVGEPLAEGCKFIIYRKTNRTILRQTARRLVLNQSKTRLTV